MAADGAGDVGAARGVGESGEPVPPCPHDCIAQPEWTHPAPHAFIVRLTCMLCDATTTVDLGDVTTNEWEAAPNRPTASGRDARDA